MKFTVNKSDLLPEIQKINKIVKQRKPDYIILNNVLLEVRENYLKLFVREKNSSFKAFVPITKSKKGATTVNIKQLKDFLESCKTDTITATYYEEKEILHLTDEHNYIELPTMDATLYPSDIELN